MICPHCAASVSENEVKCPYCDSYIDHKKKTANIEDVQQTFQKMGFPVKNDPNDKPNKFMVMLSIIPPIGFLMFFINLMSGRPKSAKVYFTVAFITMFVSVFLYIIFCFIQMHSMSRSMPDVQHYFMR